MLAPRFLCFCCIAVLFLPCRHARGQGRIIYVHGELAQKNEEAKEKTVLPGDVAHLTDTYSRGLTYDSPGAFAVADFPRQGLYLFSDTFPVVHPKTDFGKRHAGLNLLVDTLQKMLRHGRKATSSDSVSWNLYLDNQLLRMPLETANFELRCCGKKDTIALPCKFNETVHHEWDYELIITRALMQKADSLYLAVKGEDAYCLPELWIGSTFLPETAFVDYMLPMFWEREALRAAVIKCRESLLAERKKPTPKAIAERFFVRFRAEISIGEIEAALKER